MTAALALRMVRGLATDAAAAEDLVQEAARALIEHGAEHPFESRAHARNWYLRCARNLAISGLRRSGRSRVVKRRPHSSHSRRRRISSATLPASSAADAVAADSQPE